MADTVLGSPTSTYPRLQRVPVVQGDTVIDALAVNVRLCGDSPAMRYRDERRWNVITWADYAQAVREVVAGLAEFGIGPGETVGVLSANRPEWHLADLGTLASGAITVPLYLTSSSTQVAYVLGHAEARLCFVDTHEQLGKVLEARGELPKLDRVVIFDGSKRVDDTFVTSFDELRRLGASRLAREPGLYDDRAGAVTPDTVATLVYTSGTTGPPKGTIISHGNLMWAIRSATVPFDVAPGERLISFLPLSHIAERMVSDFLPITTGSETWFARSLATVVEDLPACRPTLFLAVPRVWEKLHEGVLEQVSRLPLPLRLAIGRFIDLGLRKVAAEQDGAPFGPLGRAQWELLNRTFGTRIRQQLGLDRAHALVTTAAPTHPDLIRWFHAVGMPVRELYGQTEDCGPTTVNPARGNRIGTVGPPIPGVTIRTAEDGEILVKGGHVCLGYYKDPAGTAELLDAAGWMHTGDVGVVDPDGYLRITGRKKDLIITAAGKNITPQEIETDLRYHDLISQAVVVGDGRRYLTALVTLDPDALLGWAQERGKLTDTEALTSDPDVLAIVQAAVDEVNARRSHAEWIRKFRILAHDLTVAGNELTPTMKVKRNVVYEKYAGVIDELYAEDGAS